jgi:hemoglobin
VLFFLLLLSFQLQNQMMKKDLQSKSDIEKVVITFYDRVKTDKKIGLFFTEVIKLDWDAHIVQMCSFWENVLLHTGDYKGNPLDTHRKIHKKYETKKVHFKRWLELFDTTVSEFYEGENASKMKSHARGIAVVMQEKM